MTSIIPIQNLKCGGCVSQIISSLESTNGISKVEVDLENAMVTIDYKDPAMVETAKEKLKAMGYPSDGSNNTVLDKAKSFASCTVGSVKNTLN